MLALLMAAFGAGGAWAGCGGEGEGDVLAFQTTGKLLVGLCGPKQQAAVLRLDQSGKLDGGFADDGSLGPWPSNSAPQLATTADGKLLVEMRLGLEHKHHRVVLRRFSADGVLDRSFSAGNAPVPTNPKHSSPGLIRVFSQPGGTSVVAYYAYDDGCYEGYCTESVNFLRMFRYSPAGRLIDEAQHYTEYWGLEGITMAPDGGLIVTGDSSEYRTNTYLRTKPNLKVRVGRTFDEGSGPTGAVAAAQGTSFFAGAGDGRIARYSLRGARAAGYGEAGTVGCEFDASYFTFLQGLGMAGLLAVGGDGPCGLVEFRPGGSRDTAFGSGGSVDLDALGVIPPRYRLESTAVGPAGQIALAYGSEDHPVARILLFSADGRSQTGFGTGGVVTIRDFRAR